MEAKELEKVLLGVFTEFQETIPGLRILTFDVANYSGSGKPDVRGFYHIGLECEMFSTLDKLYAILHETRAWREENEILFRRF